MSSFLRACGALGPLQLSVECQGTPQAERVSLDRPFVLIGRDPGADLRFPHRDVGDRHVYLQVVAGRLRFIDLGSRTGTFLEGRRLRSGWIAPGQAIRVGPYRVRLVGGISETAAGELEPLEEPIDDPGAGLSLELSQRGIRPTPCQAAGGLILVGNAADCGARLLDPGIAGYHTSLLHTPEGVWVVDLLGPGGVLLNGSPVRCARAVAGDVLRLGRSSIRLGPETTPGQDLLETATTDNLPEPGYAPSARGEARPAPLPPALALDNPGLLEPLARQLGLVQQELLGEWQEAGARMLQSLADLRREQAGLIQQELAQVRQLARELESLRNELAASAGRPAPAPPAFRLGIARAASA